MPGRARAGLVLSEVTLRRRQAWGSGQPDCLVVALPLALGLRGGLGARVESTARRSGSLVGPHCAAAHGLALASQPDGLGLESVPHDLAESVFHSVRWSQRNLFRWGRELVGSRVGRPRKAPLNGSAHFLPLLSLASVYHL